MGNYSRGDEATLPTGTADLETIYDATDLSNVQTDDSNYVNQTASSQYPMHEYKDTITSANANITWKGKSDQAPSTYPVHLQIYKTAAPAGWETLKTNNVASAGVDFTLQELGKATADYKDGSNVVCCRVYQDYQSGIQLGANLLIDGDMELAGVVNWPTDGTPTTGPEKASDGTSQALHFVSDEMDEGAKQYLSVTAGKWYRVGATVKVVSGSAKGYASDDTVNIGYFVSNEGTGTRTVFKCTGICRNTNANGSIRLHSYNASSEIYYDDAFFKEVTKSSMFTQQVDEGSTNVTVSVAITTPLLYAAPAGVAICMDANDPSKYILGVLNPVNGYQYKIEVYLVNGTSINPIYSDVIGGGAAYGAGKVIQLVNSSNSLTVKYDGLQQTTGIDTTGYTGTICAVFNSDDDNTLASFTHTSP